VGAVDITLNIIEAVIGLIVLISTVGPGALD
jgi:hypothetical protein